MTRLLVLSAVRCVGDGGAGGGFSADGTGVLGSKKHG